VAAFSHPTTDPPGDHDVTQTINTNLASLTAQRNLSASQAQLGTAMQRLSSGMRVNGAKDDAAGLSIAERMSTQVRGMAVAMRNANDGISMAQVGEGALGSVSNLFQRMRELAVQSANATNTSSDRASLNQEFIQLGAEARRTLAGTQFNGQHILAQGSDSVFQIGANSNASVDQLVVTGFNWADTTTTNAPAVAGITALLATDVVPASYTSGFTGVQITDTLTAQGALTTLDTAIANVNTQRANYGAVQNRFENIVSNMQVAVENQTAARSRIMDADYAAETSALSRANILQQAGNAMVAQANQLPQQVLSLLK
jgi:flagellin